MICCKVLENRTKCYEKTEFLGYISKRNMMFCVEKTAAGIEKNTKLM